MLDNNTNQDAVINIDDVANTQNLPNTPSEANNKGTVHPTDTHVPVQSTATATQEPIARTPKHALVIVLTAMAMGVAFGFLFVRTRVFEPHVIRAQFVFKKNIMLKMFMGAALASSTVFGVLDWLHPTYFRLVRGRRTKSNSKRGLAGVSLGSAMLGTGMAVAGACPGMVLAQVGTGVDTSYMTLIGGFVGAFLFGITEKFARRITHTNCECEEQEQPQTQTQQQGRTSLGMRKSSSVKSLHLEETVGLTFRQGSAVFSSVCLVFVILMEVFIPWTTEVEPNAENCIPLITCASIPPSAGGALLGLLQVPAFYIINSTLGSSTSYVTVTGSWVWSHKSLHERFEYLANNSKFTASTWWQVFYTSFAIVGAFVAQKVANSSSPAGVGLGAAFVGGFLMLYGARFAYGCTSGHGLSGMPMLMIHSIVAVGSMFGAAILTGFVYQAIEPSYAIV